MNITLSKTCKLKRPVYYFEELRRAQKLETMCLSQTVLTIVKYKCIPNIFIFLGHTVK